MYAATNSAIVWKRMADENQRSARLLAQLAMALFVLLLGVGAYAFTASTRHADLCARLEHPAAGVDATAARELASSLANGLCS